MEVRRIDGGCNGCNGYRKEKGGGGGRQIMRFVGEHSLYLPLATRLEDTVRVVAWL